MALIARKPVPSYRGLRARSLVLFVVVLGVLLLLPTLSAGAGLDCACISCRSGASCQTCDSLIDSRRALAGSQGFEFDQQEASRWIRDLTGNFNSPYNWTSRDNLLGVRVSLSDYVANAATEAIPPLLPVASAIGGISLPPVDGTGPVMGAAVAGSTAQSRVQAWPGDLDYFGRIFFRIGDESHFNPTIGLAQLAPMARSMFLERPTVDGFEIIPIEAKFGVDRDGKVITWTPREVENGVTTVGGHQWNAQTSHEFIKIDWLAHRLRDHLILNTSLVIDPLTWELGTAEFQSLADGIDPVFQEIYLDAEPAVQDGLQNLVNRGGLDLETYRAQMCGEVIKYSDPTRPNWGKAAKRLYNLLRAGECLADAAYVGELLDEPITRLYQIWSQLKGLQEAVQGEHFDHSARVAFARHLQQELAEVSRSMDVSTIATSMNLMVTSVQRGQTNQAVSEMTAARVHIIRALNDWFEPRLRAAPEVNHLIMNCSAKVGPDEKDELRKKRDLVDREDEDVPTRNQLCSGSAPFDLKIYGLNVDCGKSPQLWHLSPAHEVAVSSLNLTATTNKPVVWGFQTGSNWAAVATTELEVTRGGSYRFQVALGQSDSAKLVIDGLSVLDSGCVWDATKSGTMNLTTGRHHLQLVYTDDGWPDTLRLSYSGPDTGGADRLVDLSVARCPAAR